MPLKPRATQTAASTRPARPASPKRQRPARPQDVAPAGANLAMALMLAWLALLTWGAWAQRLPLGLLGILALLNGVTFFAYARDKNAAQRGAWRTREQTLHLLALLGGWPAAWWAQQWLRHKSRKPSFRAAYWGTVLLHGTGLAVVVLRPELLLFR